MKLRLLPIIIAVCCTGIILFGGWYFYNRVALENPLQQVVVRVPGVEQAQTELTKNRVTLNLTLTDQANIRDLYTTITTEGASIIGKRKVDLNLVSPSSSALEQWWSSALFYVAQAMETRQYSEIPKVLEARSTELSGLKVATEMDEHNVYVQLTDGDKIKYVILPRVSTPLGVWPNE